MKDFRDIYYNSVECLRCNLCLDKCPAVRALGTDKAPMYAAVYSALGSRFDLEMVTEEAFQCIDCYECESLCPVDVPIADTMAYIRKLCKEKRTVPKEAVRLADKAKKGENILSDAPVFSQGKADIAVFLGYAGELDEEVKLAFDKICKAAQVTYTFLSQTSDSGYFLDRSGQTEDVQEVVKKNLLAFEKAEAKVIVTPCSYSYEAFQSYYPDKYVYQHMSEFLVGLLDSGKLKIENKGKKAAYHAPHFLTRRNAMDAPEKLILRLSGEEALQPKRSGEYTSSSGIGGGLGLFYPMTEKLVTERRAEELAELECKTVVTGCVFEKYALKQPLKEKNIEIIDITEYVAQAI